MTPSEKAIIEARMAEHRKCIPNYTGSVAAPIFRGCDNPQPFDVEAHQIEVFKAGGHRDELWCYLEDVEHGWW